MDSYVLGGLQLPFQRRLSRLYNDTKKSSDFVKEPVQNAEDPEIKALHRKLRIQKDRLVSWGLEWSDPAQQPSSSEVLIDSSLSRAGLSEVVGSIMSTIKETLAEVEPLWLSSKQLVSSSAGGGGGAPTPGSGKGKDAGDLDSTSTITTTTTMTPSDAALERTSEKAKAVAAAGAVDPTDRDRDRDRKTPLVTWDKVRFADLVRDLTVSIDTLYDLSRTRSSATAASSSPFAAAGTPSSPDASAISTPVTPAKPALVSSTSAPPALQHQSSYPTATTPTDAARAYESSRMLVPQLIDSATLTISESAVRPPEFPPAREVVFMGKQAYASLTGRPPGEAYAPLLLEYAYFDPVFSATGVMPSMHRFERVVAGLQADPFVSGGGRSSGFSGVPRLLGYFEDMSQSRLGLVFQFPPGFHAVVSPGPDAESTLQTPATLRSCLYTLGDLLGSPDFEPRLEAKFRLAANLVNAVFEMHAKGIVHGNLVDGSVLFGRVARTGAAAAPATVALVDIRQPVVAAFELFPDAPNPDKTQSTRRSAQLHHHPLDPSSLGLGPGAPPLVDADPRVFDLYSLAMLLLSIGMWTRLENLVPHHDSSMVSEAVLEQLSTQCGTLYSKAVQACWNAMDLVAAAGPAAAADSHLARLQVRVSSYLEACCVLDTVSTLEARLRSDLGGDGLLEAASLQAETPPPPPPPRPKAKFAAGPLRPLTMARSRIVTPQPVSLEAPPVPPKTSGTSGLYNETETTRPETTMTMRPAAATERRSSPKIKLYPHVALPADVVEKWHELLMPQVNQALRHFYRSHAESVEISLEAVGETARTTRPTVVVVCTSVGKVRSILKRKMGAVFEGGGGVGLKVCSGRVVRSGAGGRGGGGRNDYTSKHVVAANSQFQQKPANGASIGAWVGGRHLPPVSFGGLVLVDDKPFGMTVHHMLDDPDALEGAGGQAAVVRRSSRRATGNQQGSFSQGMEGDDEDNDEDTQVQELGQSVLDWYAELQADAESAGSATSGGDDEDYACAFSDTSSAVSESDITSAWSDSEAGTGDRTDDDGDGGDDEFGSDAGSSRHRSLGEPGDMPGVEPGYGDGYVVTQPALDDVDGNFYPDADTQDEDHLDSCGLGDVYASSGVRRRTDEHGLVHEIDWALFGFREERQPVVNAICAVPVLAEGEAADAAMEAVNDSVVLSPTTVAPVAALPGLEVQCMARTSGLQTGRILPTLASVKIYGRASPSHTYQIAGPARSKAEAAKVPPSGLPIGIPGDSGAWIVERGHGRLCGHVLAWSERKRVAYLCPMDVLLLDIAETLEASEVRLPGGDAVVKVLGEDKMEAETAVMSTTARVDMDDVDANLADGSSRKSGRWTESTRMLELVGSMGEVRANVQAPC